MIPLVEALRIALLLAPTIQPLLAHIIAAMENGQDTIEITTLGEALIAAGQRLDTALQHPPREQAGTKE
jgi:hypothetical protein